MINITPVDVAAHPNLTSSKDPFDALNVLVWKAIAGVVSTNTRWL